MKKITLRLLILSSVVYLLLCTFLYLYQGSLLYLPQDRLVADEQNTLLLSTDVGNTVVTTEVREGEKAIIYFGGNAEDVSKRLDEFRKTFPNHSLYLMHYRGYGGSDGKPREEQIFQDARALYTLVSKSKRDISLIGYSLGSGVATRLAVETLPNKLILVTPFSSIEDVASERYWGVPVSLLLKDKFLSWRYAREVKSSTAILLATDDQVISRESTMKLLEHFDPDVATLFTFEGEDHSSIISSSQYFDLLNKLMD